MRNTTLFAGLLTLALAPCALGQVNPAITAGSQPAAAQNPASITRARVLAQSARDRSVNEPGSAAQNLQARIKTNFKERERLQSLGAEIPGESSKSSPDASAPIFGASNSDVRASVNTSANVSPLLSQIYRVGVGDVLDIELQENPLHESTLFTVLSGGTLEYPLAGSPVAVAGMTTAEISAALKQRIKIFEKPNVKVTVRDFSSHRVVINGFVAAPGTVALRREAVPLYTLLAQVSVLPEAARATITRAGRAIVIDLKDPNLAATLVLPGDVIKISASAPAATEFFFVGGKVKSPGQKVFHAGLTLTQAVLACGGTTTTTADRIKIYRQGADGRLLTEEHNLRKIREGKVVDPVLQKGDRIEVSMTN